MPSLLPTPEPADPVEGQPGHFEHSNWLKASVKALDSGVVHKDGDTMTGDLRFPAGKGIAFTGNAVRITDVVGYGNDVSVIVDPSGELANLRAKPPTAVAHVATKGYVDTRVQSGHAQADASGNYHIAFVPPFKSPPSIVATQIGSSGGAGVPATFVVWDIAIDGGYIGVRGANGTPAAGAYFTWIAVGPA